MDAIDWGTAQQVGELVAGSPPFGGVGRASVQPLADDFARRVASYSMLELTTAPPPLEVVDRPAWIAANLRNMTPLLGTLTEQMARGGGPLAGPLRSVSRQLLGVQVGTLMGILSQRVLGQYDLSLLDPSQPSRLLLVGPNLTMTAHSLGVDRDELVVWVTIHEITHAVQFAGTPWLRGHLEGMVRELIDGLTATIEGGMHPRPGHRSLADALSGALELGDMRQLIERARRGELLRLTLGEDRWELVERIQAVMSLIEGHAEHTMDVVGAELLPSLPRLRAAMTRRRESRSLSWRVLERLLGLSMKMRQYEVGRAFCDAVVSEGGAGALARAWSAAEALPSTAELKDPSAWLARTDAASEPPAGAGRPATAV
ncbi:MAG TPA: zinc-dependent metalloprotease [Solirubrobacteraceae bacterium]|nr:zinc-dependent metalloprotease [Solirubrobacteraceae bacterium]